MLVQNERAQASEGLSSRDFGKLRRAARVAGSADRDTRATRALHEKIRDDPRVDVGMIPAGDGLTLAGKRG